VTDLDRVLRWEDAGGTWRVGGRHPGRFTVTLYRCDGGEEIDRFTTGEPDLIAYVGDRETSEQSRPDLAD
jgi:hypothetical protein